MILDAPSTSDAAERAPGDESGGGAAVARDEAKRAKARGYPISRWYVFPVTERLAAILAPTGVRPTHVTLIGLLLGLSAVGAMFAAPVMTPLAAVLVLAAWFADRTDGPLARCQGTGSPFGAWLDANVDEFHDVAWHTAAAYAAATVGGTNLPWFLLIGFLGGKYLFMTSVAEERQWAEPESRGANESDGWIRTAYHLPGNADVRLHLLVAALLSGLMTAELAIVAVYYNLRWIVRFGLVARRMGGGR